MSERIVRLERSVGAELFARGARGATMTPAGERFLPYARRVLGLLEEATEAARSFDASPPLRVAVHVTFAHRVVPLVLAAVADPPRAINVRDAHSDEIIAMLLDRVVDVGFVLPGARPPALQFVSLPADRVICVCAPSHPLATRARVSLQALAEHRVALNRWGTGASDFLAQLAAAGVPEWNLTECSDAVTALRLARHHGHVALATASIATEELGAGNLVHLELRPAPKWSVPLALAYRVRDRDDPCITGVATAVRRLGSGPRRAHPKGRRA